MNILGIEIRRAPPVEQRLPNLAGDRELEWSYCALQIGKHASPQAAVLDFGCGNGVLTLAAALVARRVLAIDLLEQPFVFEHQQIEFRRTDVMQLDEQREQFDVVVNCSTIEHVGLAGRYNAVEAPDGDLQAMQKLRKLLKPGGTMILTLPVGQDQVVKPFHRIYGAERLPKLLEGFNVVKSQFWRKDRRNVWLSCSQDEAVREAGNDHYYAIGCMVLQHQGGPA